MQYFHEDDLLVFSATDLTRMSDCLRANALEIDVAMGRREAPPRIPADVYTRAGLRHERAVLDQYIREFGSENVLIVDDSGRYPDDRRAAAEKTRAAVASGVPVIHQGVLWKEIDSTTAYLGLADFLVRDDEGAYQVIDTKLAKAVKEKYLVQVGMYAEVLEEMTGIPAVDPAILLGTGELSPLALEKVRVVAQEATEEFLELLAPRRAMAMEAPRAHSNPACRYCRFRDECGQIWRERGDLSLVAGIGGQTVQTYERAGFGSLFDLAQADENAPPEDVGAQTWSNHVRQARLQARAMSNPDAPIPVEVVDRQSLDDLPAPGPGDLYFDIEGYAVAPLQLEYLFGLWDGSEFIALWAHSADQEKEMLTAFVQEVDRRRKINPDLHIYYYNHYETTALRRLAKTYKRHEAEVEELCSEVMINLMPVVKSSLMAGLPGYGLKDLERLHGYSRAGEIKTAGDSVDLYDQWLYDGRDQRLLDAIAEYNLEDLQSTQALHHWLASL